MKDWLVTLRRDGGATYDPIRISAAGPADAVELARQQLRAGGEADAIYELIWITPADPT